MYILPHLSSSLRLAGGLHKHIHNSWQLTTPISRYSYMNWLAAIVSLYRGFTVVQVRQPSHSLPLHQKHKKGQMSEQEDGRSLFAGAPAPAVTTCSTTVYMQRQTGMSHRPTISPLRNVTRRVVHPPLLTLMAFTRLADSPWLADVDRCHGLFFC